MTVKRKIHNIFSMIGVSPTGSSSASYRDSKDTKRLFYPHHLKLADSGIYKNAHGMSPPPAEEKNNVVQFELTTGCKHNACTYCTIYKDQKFYSKDIDEIKSHIDDVWINLKKNLSRSEIRKLNRIFLGAGNALSLDTDTFNEATKYAIKSFHNNIGGIPKRVAAYASISDLVKKSDSELKLVRCGGTCFGGCSSDLYGEKVGLSVVYIGLESGSDKVLKYVNKGYDNSDIARAIRGLKYAGIRSSVMVIPGLGGIKYYDRHVRETVDILRYWEPEWVTFIGLDVKQGTAYHSKMQKEIEGNSNRPLTEKELVQQTADIISQLNISTTIGLHGRDIHKYGSNPVVIGAKEVHSRYDSKLLAEKILSLYDG